MLFLTVVDKSYTAEKRIHCYICNKMSTERIYVSFAKLTYGVIKNIFNRNYRFSFFMNFEEIVYRVFQKNLLS